MKVFKHLAILTSFLSIVAQSQACDLCGCYSPSLEIVTDKPSHFYTSIAEQFTYFGTLRDGGHEVANPTGQYMDSFNTQFVLGTKLLNDRLGLQINVPFIYRSFERPEGFTMDRGSVSGIGDVSLLANFQLFKVESGFQDVPTTPSKGGKSVSVMKRGEPNFSSSLNLIAGIKFATGDSSRIKEEFHEIEVEGAPESGIHGHDLALGTGSYDGVFGLQSFTSYKSFFMQADVTFTWRGAGKYSYRFANDITWGGGPGVYLLREGDNNLALQLSITGETKGTDTFQGNAAEDTGVTALYLGPRLLANFGRWSGDVSVELPVIMNNTALQAVPDYRIRAGLTFHF